MTSGAGETVCDWCGEPLPSQELRVTVLHEDGSAIVVHRACLAGLRRLSLEELRQLSVQAGW